MATQLTCPKCGEKILTEGAAPAKSTPTKPEIPMPKGFELSRGGTSFQLVRRWFSFKYVPLLFFCIAWDGFLIFWYAMAFSSPKTPWIAFVFPIFHLAIGVGLTYVVIAGFVNRTWITAERDTISVRHGPVPMGKALSFRRRDIEQFFCWAKPSKNGATYQVDLLLAGRVRHPFVSELETLEQARFIEQELERYLGIADAPVPGEYGVSRVGALNGDGGEDGDGE